MKNNIRSSPLQVKKKNKKRKEGWSFSPGFEGGSCCKVKPKTAFATNNSIPRESSVASCTQPRSFISPKQLKYRPSSGIQQQQREQFELSATDMTMVAPIQTRTFISPNHSKHPPSGRIHQQQHDCVTNYNDISSYTDTSSEVLRKISNTR